MSKIINTSDETPRLHVTRRMLVVAGIALLVLTAVGGMAYFTKNRIEQKNANIEIPKDSVSVASDEASKIAATKNPEEALKYYDSKIADSKDQDEKIQLFLGKSAIAYDAGDFDAAMKAAVEANSLKENSAALDMIARCYEAKGDKTKALEYFKKELAIFKPGEVSNRLEIYLKAKIQELSGA